MKEESTREAALREQKFWGTKRPRDKNFGRKIHLSEIVGVCVFQNIEIGEKEPSEEEPEEIV